MSDVFIDSYYPNRDYQQLPSLAEKLSHIGAASVWLPYSPVAVGELEKEGYFQLFSYTGGELRIGKETPRGLQAFEDRVLDDAEAIAKLAVVSRVTDGEIVSRQVYVVARPGFSE